ncbi:MAG TPA: DinB family protein [Silvibacterium sp.]|nr:DinB family protein [Silvibacterium sp.]
MKKSCALITIVLAIAGTSFAQGRAGDRTPGQKNSDQVEYLLQFTERKVLAVAEAMPAEKYGFAPKAGEFKGVRNFREQLKHIAADNYLDGATLLAAKSPAGDLGPGESGSASVKTKAEVIAYLKDSFAYLHRGVRMMDDGNAPLAKPGFLPYGPGITTRLLVMLANIGHTNDHYGQLVEYLRMNGIVPPASRASSGKTTSR